MVSERLWARITRDFPGQAADVMERLNALDLPQSAENQSRERIQAAIVLLADGDNAKLEYNAQLAETDWRDVLVFSGLGDEDWPVRLDVELGRADIANPSQLAAAVAPVLRKQRLTDRSEIPSLSAMAAGTSPPLRLDALRPGELAALDARPTDYVFTSDTNGPRAAYRKAQWAFVRARKKAKLSTVPRPFRFHDYATRTAQRS